MMYRVTHRTTGKFTATVPYDELWRFPEYIYDRKPIGPPLPAPRRPQLAADMRRDPWPDHPRRG